MYEECGEIHVIGAGLGRTGTKSLQAALNILGYKTYHFVDPDHAKYWADYSEGKVSSDVVIDAIVGGGYSATCDQPTADIYREQLERFPNAKVVLTVRDNPVKWEVSWKTLMRFVEVQERPFSLLYPSFLQWIPFMAHWKTMRSLMGTHLGLLPGELIRGWSSKPEGWLGAQYEKHNTQVIDTVPSQQLLVFNVKEGWAPLCNFLQKDIPATAFPNVNESEDIANATRIFMVVTYAWVPLMAAVGSLGYWGFRHMQRS